MMYTLVMFRIVFLVSHLNGMYDTFNYYEYSAKSEVCIGTINTMMFADELDTIDKKMIMLSYMIILWSLEVPEKKYNIENRSRYISHTLYIRCEKVKWIKNLNRLMNYIYITIYIIAIIIFNRLQTEKFVKKKHPIWLTQNVYVRKKRIELFLSVWLN